MQPLDVKPILVLTGEPDAQQTVFYDQLHTGDRVLLFGAIHTEDKDPSAAPEVMDPAKPRITGGGGTIRGKSLRRRAGKRRRVDPGKDGPAPRVGRAGARQWPVDTFLYARWRDQGAAELQWLVP